MATIDEFQNIEMRIGRILSAEYVPGADKLLRLSVDFGPLPTPAPSTSLDALTPTAPMSPPAERDIRQILSGIREYYEPEELIGKQCPFVTNLPVRTLRGLESHGMILAVKTEDGGAVLLHPDKEVSEGNKLS
jgi:tRNA-binding EMAP/Myf-like protein